MTQVGLIGREGWWKLTEPGGRTVWMPEDPSDRLHAAWEGATVEGPFVPYRHLEGAVEALERIEPMLAVAHMEAGRVAIREVVREALASLNRTGGQ